MLTAAPAAGGLFRRRKNWGPRDCRTKAKQQLKAKADEVSSVRHFVITSRRGTRQFGERRMEI